MLIHTLNKLKFFYTTTNQQITVHIMHVCTYVYVGDSSVRLKAPVIISFMNRVQSRLRETVTLFSMKINLMDERF